MQLVGTITDEALVTAAEEVIAIRDRQAELATIAEQAETTFKALAIERKVASITVTDGTVVTIVKAVRRNFNAEAMAELVTAAVFSKISKVTVSATKFDAAVVLGIVDEEKVASAISPTPYVAIKVNGGPA